MPTSNHPPQLKSITEKVPLPWVLGVLTLAAIAFIFAAFAVTTNDLIKGSVIGLGAGLFVNALTLWVQARIKNEDAERMALEVHDLKTDIASLAAGGTVESTIGVLDQYSDLTLNEIIRGARTKLLMFAVSSRNFLNPQTFEIIKAKVKNEADTCKIQMLCLNPYDADHFVRFRSAMMNIKNQFNDYEGDLKRARELSRQVALTDPEHKFFDVRFYAHMPTTFFVIADDVLYVTFLLSRPVSECPVFRVDLKSHPRIAKRFEDHFSHYWNESRFFASVVGLRNDDQFLMVKNKKEGRGWEWPTGYIEPGEAPEQSARREFIEESGYEISELKEVQRTSHGIFYAGRVGRKVGSESAREISETKFFSKFPDAKSMSFREDLDTFKSALRHARALLASGDPS
jgi:8-oxo-dGTP pyrophosphatase MutT (NUDIX family)